MKKRILLIDDDLDFCLLLSKFLNQNDYETQIANNGEAAIRKMTGSEFDAVLCDFRLGDMNGKDFLLKLNELDLHPILIFVTGYAIDKLFSEVIRLGAYDYLSKPLIPGEILLILSEAFQNSSLKATAANNLIFQSKNENKLPFSANGFIL